MYFFLKVLFGIFKEKRQEFCIFTNEIYCEKKTKHIKNSKLNRTEMINLIINISICVLQDIVYTETHKKYLYESKVIGINSEIQKTKEI